MSLVSPKPLPITLNTIIPRLNDQSIWDKHFILWAIFTQWSHTLAFRSVRNHRGGFLYMGIKHSYMAVVKATAPEPMLDL